jgi:acyl-CoA thioester hydrolase
MKESELKVRVLYKDTDQMGIVYYGRYFEFFEAGRNELLREMGLPYSELEGEGYFLPVIESYCKYLKGAKYDEIIIIKSKIIEKKGSKIKIHYEVRDETGNKLFAEGYTVHAFVNKKGKPCKPPKKFNKLVK